ncbi:MAG TPA: hypothetical protein VGP84_05085 [Gemmatimonadaceae bacterium]|jgi:hypothetical protein|nr:hypothetical protein [Gemmatimonadaceae bacterium]
MSRRLLPALGVLLALGAAYACHSDSTLAPSASSGSSLSAGTAQSGRRDVDPATVTVVALRRNFNLPVDVSASAVIGPHGGEIDLWASGARIVFPAGALSAPTRITMTAKAGWNVAYEFSPHGIVFNVPVTVQQDLNWTSFASGNDGMVRAGYYPDSLSAALVGPSLSIARVSELRRADLDRPLNPNIATFDIFHFSGYILSSGFVGGGGDTDGDLPQP